MASIRFEKVSKNFGKVNVIKDVDLEIRDKEFMVLVGPSGCGKSTLLRMIAGLEEISSGQLWIADKIVNDLPPKDRDIAIVFQNYALYPHMTAYDNLAFCLKISGLDKKTIREKVMEAAHILEIEPLLDRKPKAMSGGQRQRVAIGRAIVRNPKVFLFDEPLSNLDAKLRGQMRLEIARLHQKLQTTVVYVTHDQVEAMTLGDRIAVINKGEIQQIDTPYNLYNHPKNRFVAGFIGSPPMNFVEGAIGKGENGLFFKDKSNALVAQLGKRQALEAYIGKEITMGIRPEHIHARPEKDRSNYASFEADIQLVERLGYESFAFAQLQDVQFTARLSADEAVDPPCKMTLWIDLEKIHFFDNETGEVVSN
ncbi:MAG: sn-glycerol-3-phosphate ABC transporter ATP-binding protein UgpC [Saprospiraceae bacterium]|nr:sn-glycerol-3-phosphate ABC transporter ATP-binding protein UgpC [Saprospiraceae bacterium]